MRPQRPLSANRWGAPQIGHQMSFITLENGFTYDPRLLDVTSFSEQRVARAKELQARQKTLEGREAWVAGWVAFNILRTNGENRRHAESQAEEIHGVWQSYPDRGLSACRCGLIAEVFMNDTEFLKSPGHIFTPERTLRTFFVAVPSETFEIKGKNYFCQTCGVTGAAETDEKGYINLASLQKARQNHDCATFATDTKAD